MKRRIYRVAARADTTRLNPPILDTLEVDLNRGDDCSEVIKHIRTERPLLLEAGYKVTIHTAAMEIHPWQEFPAWSFKEGDVPDLYFVIERAGTGRGSGRGS